MADEGMKSETEIVQDSSSADEKICNNSNSCADNLDTSNLHSHVTFPKGVTSLVPASVTSQVHASVTSLVRARDFQLKIQQLEEEREQILAASELSAVQSDLPRDFACRSPSPVKHSTKSRDITFENIGITPFTKIGPFGSLRGRAASLSSLIDVSNEQRTIEELRRNLESQVQETERLQQELLSLPTTTAVIGDDAASTISSGGIGHSTNPGDEVDEDDSNRELYNIVGRPQMLRIERSSTADKEQIESLRSRLRDTLDLCERQKRNFRATIEGLNSKLSDSVVSRDSLLEMKESESRGQESLISKLQQNIQHLQDNNKALEEKIKDLTSTMSTNQQSSYMLESAVKRIRTMLTDFENSRERPLFDNEAVMDQSASMLVHCVERCLQDLSADSQTQKNKAKKWQSDLVVAQRGHDSQRQTLMTEHREKLVHLAEEHEKQLTAAADRSVNSRKQAACLQEQMDLMQEQQNQQIRQKNDSMVETEAKLKLVSENYLMDKELWTNKRQALESSLDSLLTDKCSLKSERSDIIQESSSLQSKCNELESTVARLQRELESDRREHEIVTSRDQELRTRFCDAETRLEKRSLEVCRLEAQLVALRQENELNMKVKVASIEKDEQEKFSEKQQQVQLELAVMTERYKNSCIDLDQSRTELASMRATMTDFRDKLEILQKQLISTSGQKDNFSTLLEQRKDQCDKLTLERDHYAELLSEKNSKTTSDESEHEIILTNLDEKTKALVNITEQLDNLTKNLQLSNKNYENLKSEHLILKQLHTECKVDLDTTRLTRETTSKKLKLREKRLKEIETDRLQLLENIQKKDVEVDDIKNEKESLFRELKESRYEISHVTEERDSLRTMLEGGSGDKDEQINQLMVKLRGLEKEVNSARSTMRKQSSLDDKALRAAGRMQREVTMKRSEVDALKDKLYWLEECLQTINKEKSALEEEIDGYRLRIQSLSDQNKMMISDLDTTRNVYQELREKYLLLETSSEKTSVKQSTLQAQLERNEQEFARLKLKHQLDIKEARRNTPESRCPTAYYPSRQPVTPPTYVQVSPSMLSSCHVNPSILTSGRVGQYQPGIEVQSLPYVYNMPSSGPSIQQQQQQQQQQQPENIDKQQESPKSQDLKEEMKQLVANMGALLSRTSQLSIQQTDLNAQLDSDYLDTVSDDVISEIDDVTSQVCYQRSKEPTCSIDAILARYRAHDTPTPPDQPITDEHVSRDDDVSALRCQSPERLTLTSKLRNRKLSPVGKLLGSPSEQATNQIRNSQSPRSSVLARDRNSQSPRSSVLPHDKPHDVTNRPSRPQRTRTTVDDVTWPRPARSRVDDVRASLETDSNMLCRRLESKMENLLKMGDTLQKENKEVSGLMMEQDKRMKKLKGTKKSSSTKSSKYASGTRSSKS